MGGHNVPEKVRRQWCNALDRIVDRFSEGLAPAGGPARLVQATAELERTQAKLATEIEIMKAPRVHRPTWCRIVLGGAQHG